MPDLAPHVGDIVGLCLLSFNLATQRISILGVDKPVSNASEADQGNHHGCNGKGKVRRQWEREGNVEFSGSCGNSVNFICLTSCIKAAGGGLAGNGGKQWRRCEGDWIGGGAASIGSGVVQWEDGNDLLGNDPDPKCSMELDPERGGCDGARTTTPGGATALAAPYACGVRPDGVPHWRRPGQVARIVQEASSSEDPFDLLRLASTLNE